jgi:hypothetical protein
MVPRFFYYFCSSFISTLCGVMQAKRQAVTAVYEARAMPEDHKVGGEGHMNRSIN